MKINSIINLFLNAINRLKKPHRILHFQLKTFQYLYMRIIPVPHMISCCSMDASSYSMSSQLMVTLNIHILIIIPRIPYSRGGNKSMFIESIYFLKFKKKINSNRCKSKILNIRQKPFFEMKLKKKPFFGLKCQKNNLDKIIKSS